MALHVLIIHFEHRQQQNCLFLHATMQLQLLEELFMFLMIDSNCRNIFTFNFILCFTKLIVQNTIKTMQPSMMKILINSAKTAWWRPHSYGEYPCMACTACYNNYYIASGAGYLCAPDILQHHTLTDNHILILMLWFQTILYVLFFTKNHHGYDSM